MPSLLHIFASQNTGDGTPPPPPGSGVAAVSNTVGPVAGTFVGFDRLTVSDSIQGWSAGDGLLGYLISPGDTISGWTTGDSTS